MKESKETIVEIRKAMQRKVESVLPEFDEMELSQTVRSTQGELVEKANPAIQEARALFRDFCAIVRAENEIAGTEAEVDNLESLRNKFKVIG